MFVTKKANITMLWVSGVILKDGFHCSMSVLRCQKVPLVVCSDTRQNVCVQSPSKLKIGNGTGGRNGAKCQLDRTGLPQPTDAFQLVIIQKTQGNFSDSKIKRIFFLRIHLLCQQFG